jgi:4-diphosphocytidyl-2-C-methyl-D-erythritol kinase
MIKTEVKAPAKINIGLYVTEKRQDGYHNIETIFYPINLYDIIKFEDSDYFSFSSNLKNLPTDSTNLIIQAKNILEDYSGEKLNIKIFLDKRIPLGAGLGGGSSDAAVTLVKLNELAGLNLSTNEIFDLGLSLGSDIPFFINPQPSFASGRGEYLQSQLIDLELPLVIVNPGIIISTKWAYSQIQPDIPNFNLKELGVLDWEHLRLYTDKIMNVFEKPVFEKYPLIKEIKSLHYKLGAVFSLMSGSGSTVYGIYSDKERALTAIRILKEKGYFVFAQNLESAL